MVYPHSTASFKSSIFLTWSASAPNLPSYPVSKHPHIASSRTLSKLLPVLSFSLTDCWAKTGKISLPSNALR